MEKRRVLIDDLEEGMLAAADIVSESGSLIVRKNVELEGKHMGLLSHGGVKEIDVLIPEKKPGVSENIRISDYPEHEELLLAQKVLVVDDSKLIRSKLKHIISDAGFNIIGEAVDGVEAVAMAKIMKPTLITLDIEMENMDGITAIQPLLSADPGVMIVMISSLGADEKIIEAISEGALDFISKPFDPERVKKTLINTVIMQGSV